MESFGECKGCQRNIKFAVKQARLCRTCYNKTYLTSQKRREYYKNKKRRREMNNASTSVEPAINVHQHRSSSHSSARSIKKTSTSSGHATEQQQQDYHHQPSIQAHHHSGPSCADWVPRQADGFSLLAALAHAASSPSSSPAVRPYFSASSSSSSSSSSLPSSPPSSPPAAAALSLASTTSSASSSTLLPYQQLQLQYQMHQLHVAQAASRSPPSSASPLTASPYGSPLQAGSALLHDLLQQASAGYPQSYYAAALVAAASSTTTTTTATVAPPAYSATPKPVTALPSLASVLGGCAPTSSPVAIPTARHAYSPSSTSSEAVTSTAPKSMAIRNLLN